MRRISVWVTLSLVALCAVVSHGPVTSAGPRPQREILIGVQSASVNVGDVFQVDIYAHEVSSVDVTLSFPPAMLQVVDTSGQPTDEVDIVECPGIGFVLINTANNATGVIRAGYAMGICTTLARIRFKAIAPGIAPLVFTNVEWLDFHRPDEPEDIRSVDGLVAIDVPAPTATPTSAVALIHGYLTAAPECGYPRGLRASLFRDTDPYAPIVHVEGPDSFFRFYAPALPGTYHLQVEPNGDPVPPCDVCTLQSITWPGGRIASHPYMELTFTGDNAQFANIEFHYDVFMTRTPTPTDSPTDVQIHGVVRDNHGTLAPGTPVTLLRLIGSTWQTKANGITGADGAFRLFSSPVPGTYRLVITPRAGYYATGATLPPGSTGRLVSPDTVEFALAPGVARLGPFSFAVTPMPTPVPTIPPPPISLLGYVWADANGDGARQDAEGYPGVEITASGQGVTLTTTSGDAGYYAIRGLAESAYTLTTRDPLGRLPPSAQPVTVGDDPLKPTELDWRWWRAWIAEAR